MTELSDKFIEGTSGVTLSVGTGSAFYGTFEFMKAMPRIPYFKNTGLEAVAAKATNFVTEHVSAPAIQGQALPGPNLALWVSGALGVYAGYQLLSKKVGRGLTAAVMAVGIPLVSKGISEIPQTAYQTAAYLYNHMPSVDAATQYNQTGTILGVACSSMVVGIVLKAFKDIFTGNLGGGHH